MRHLLTSILAPGFVSSQPVHTALLVAGVAALISGLIGVFTVIRGQSFAGHALADISSAGGSASFLLGVSPLLGFLCLGLLGAASMGLVPVRRTQESDIVTGVVLGAGLGLSALFLYLDVKTTSTTGAAITVMFGSIFSVSPDMAWAAILVGAVALITVATLYRPLLLSCLDSELAAARGIRVGLVGWLHLTALALAVALSAMTTGAILSTALLVGPAATAIRLTDKPGMALLLAPLIGFAACAVGILLAYDSYDWTSGHGWPVSFFIVALIVIFYVLGTAHAHWRRRSFTARVGQPSSPNADSL